MASTQSSALDSLSSALGSAPPSELLRGGMGLRGIDHAPNKKRNTKGGRAWDYGQEYESVEDANVHAWRCNFCSQDAIIVLPSRAIDPTHRHLQAKHPAVWGDH